MTAVRNQATLDILSAVADLASFIHEHGDKLGKIADLSNNTVQVGSARTEPQSSPAAAAALISWLYLLDNAKLSVFEGGDGSSSTYAHVTVYGRLPNGRFLRAYAGIYGAGAAYLLSVPEVTVHSLRRIQIGDVPAVDAEAAQS